MNFKQSSQHIIGLDLDGVIIDHTANKIRLAREFGFDLTLEETPSDIIRTKLLKDTHDKIQWHLYDDPDMALSASLVTGAREGLELLRASQLPYILISRRKKPEIARQLLERFGLWPTYFDDSNTFFVKNSAEKNERAKALNVTTYLDDQPSVIAALADVPQKFLFDPHGVYAPSPQQYRTVKSWIEFLKHVTPPK